MEAVSSRTSSDNRSTNPGSTSSIQPPSDLAAFGLILDRNHAGISFPLINERGRTTFNLWQRQPRFSYCVLGGQLHRPDGGFVGGLAADWPAAMALFQRAWAKLDAIATTQGASFSSAWFFLLNDEQTAEARAVMALHQQVEGSA